MTINLVDFRQTPYCQGIRQRASTQNGMYPTDIDSTVVSRAREGRRT